MLSFQNFKTTKTTFKKIYKNAYDYGFSSEDTEKKYYSQIHKINRVLKPYYHTSISQSYLCIDVNEVLYNKCNEYFKESNVEFVKTYRKKDTLFVHNLFWYITELMDSNETISISISLNNYIYDEDEKEYSTHSVLMILHPSTNNTSKKKDYNMFWLNSHGGALKYTDFHYKKLSSTRVIKKQFTSPIDFMIAKQFVSSFQQFTQKNKIKHQTIHYETDYQHNYLCANLQYSDNHGCCFIFPILFNLILHTNYNKYFINDYKDQVKSKSTVASLLEEKNIELFVYQCLAQIDNRLHQPILTYYETKEDEVLDDKIEEHLDHYKEKFIKNVLIKTMGFIKQTYWSIASFNKKSKK